MSTVVPLFNRLLVFIHVDTAYQIVHVQMHVELVRIRGGTRNPGGRGEYILTVVRYYYCVHLAF